MKLYSLIVDDFLEDFLRWRTWLDTANYHDVVNPADGVTYPGICDELPAELAGEVLCKLQAWCGKSVRVNYIFARLSVTGRAPPHWAHNDASMGRMSMMLYMNRRDDCAGGTVLLSHAECGDDVPPDVWERDTNDVSKWDYQFRCPPRPNRAFIFPAAHYHAAEPRGGFGTTAQDGRLVITTFFD